MKLVKEQETVGEVKYGFFLLQYYTQEVIVFWHMKSGCFEHLWFLIRTAADLIRWASSFLVCRVIQTVLSVRKSSLNPVADVVRSELNKVAKTVALEKKPQKCYKRYYGLDSFGFTRSRSSKTELFLAKNLVDNCLNLPTFR